MSLTQQEFKRLISTDLIEKGTWLVSTTLLDLQEGHPFCGDVLAIYGYDTQSNEYIGESLKCIVTMGVKNSNVVKRISAIELQDQFSKGYWTKLSGYQALKVATLSTLAQQASAIYQAQLSAISSLSTIKLQGYEWKLLNGVDSLVPIGATDTSGILGFYEKKDRKWIVWYLDSDDPDKIFLFEETDSEDQCKAAVVVALQELDPESRVYIFQIGE